MLAIAHIEDCLVDSQILNEILRDKFEVFHFIDLKKFLKSQETFDLIIADLRLPDSYGFETVKAVKKAHKNTPIIILTGMGGAFLTGDLIQSLFTNGADNVVSKDLLADGHLLEILSKAIEP